MSRVLVVPDIHLKPWIFDIIESVDKDDYDNVVFLGDWVDDFGQGFNIDLYKKTLDLVIEFASEHENSLLCMGNHDFSYIHGMDETGYSSLARLTVVNKLEELNFSIEDRLAIIHKIDNLVFSHAGISYEYMTEVRHNFSTAENISPDISIEDVIEFTNENQTVQNLWGESSPIWTRYPLTNLGDQIKEGDNLYQVIGHTPMRSVTKKDHLIMTDVFSTRPNGDSYGEENLIIIDSLTGGYDYID